MELIEIFDLLKPCAHRDGFDVAAVQAHLTATNQKEAFVQSLTKQITQAELSNEVWLQATQNDQPADFERAIATLWETLWNWDDGDWQQAEGYPENKWTKGALRIWAYTESWFLIQQDEDLLLMEEELMPDLLSIATEAECPKRQYLIAISAHWARDGAFFHVGTPAFADFVARVGKLEPAAAAASAHLASYFARLATYGHNAPVSEAEAIQRGLDLTRCTEPRRELVIAQREGDVWRVPLPGIEKKELFISCLDGQMRASRTR